MPGRQPEPEALGVRDLATLGIDTHIPEYVEYQQKAQATTCCRAANKTRVGAVPDRRPNTTKYGRAAEQTRVCKVPETMPNTRITCPAAKGSRENKWIERGPD